MASANEKDSSQIMRDEIGEAEGHSVVCLQQLVCHLLRRNQELRVAINGYRALDDLPIQHVSSKQSFLE